MKSQAGYLNVVSEVLLVILLLLGNYPCNSEKILFHQLHHSKDIARNVEKRLVNFVLVNLQW